MFPIIVSIIFLLSLIVLAVIIFRKIPLLLQMPETEPFRFSWQGLLISIKDSLPLGNFSFEILLQKILSKVRVLTLKTDNKTSSWLQKLRERGQKKKFDEDDNYWREIKNHTRK